MTEDLDGSWSFLDDRNFKSNMKILPVDSIEFTLVQQVEWTWIFFLHFYLIRAISIYLRTYRRLAIICLGTSRFVRMCRFSTLQSNRPKFKSIKNELTFPNFHLVQSWMTKHKHKSGQIHSCLWTCQQI